MTDNQQRLEDKFWDALEQSPFLMLGLQGVDDAFTRPMTAQVDGATIYFFANASDDLVRGLQHSNRAVATFASKGHQLFASVHGTLHLSNDREVVERLWNPIIASWFKDAKDDPDLALVRFETSSADVWEADAGASLKAAAIKLLGRDPGKKHQDEHRAEVAL
ncbi:MAG: pyridoxamine 5'-phosphate oxidase family protein [Pseudomonadota bacterium]|nr:pyridoxamine 5'-phosphate oxidase family protein [Pseudomonadota bacterium]